MKNIIASIYLICSLGVCALAQKVSVHPQKEKILENKVTGYKSTINGSPEDIIYQWTKKLRSLGKYRQRGTYATIINFSIGKQLFEDSTIYANTQSDETSVTVWLGSPVTDTENYSVDEFLKSSVYDFVVAYYRSVVQKQIDEAERAVSITNRRHQRLVKDSVVYSAKLISTKNKIIRLEHLVEKNKLETKVLEERLFVNQNARDSVLLEIGKMKQIVEQHKKRKNAIE